MSVPLPFVKLHGTGNDYVFVDGFVHTVERPDEVAQAISDRRTGVGADGLILVLPPEGPEAHARMAMFNADGSPSAMCGNGLRCVGKLLFDRDRAPAEMIVETAAGLYPVCVEEQDADGRALTLSVEMGEPCFERTRIPMVGPPGPVVEEPFEIEGRSFPVTAVQLGNPHCVIFVDDVEKAPLATLGPQIEHHPRFPERVNVEFVQRLGENVVAQRTWERGSGETWACGSGAVAAAAAVLRAAGRGGEVEVRLRGGQLRVEWQGEGHPAILHGEAVEVFRGEWTVPAGS